MPKPNKGLPKAKTVPEDLDALPPETAEPALLAPHSSRTPARSLLVRRRYPGSKILRRQGEVTLPRDATVITARLVRDLIHTELGQPVKSLFVDVGIQEKPRELHDDEVIDKQVHSVVFIKEENGKSAELETAACKGRTLGQSQARGLIVKYASDDKSKPTPIVYITGLPTPPPSIEDLHEVLKGLGYSAVLSQIIYQRSGEPVAIVQLASQQQADVVIAQLSGEVWPPPATSSFGSYRKSSKDTILATLVHLAGDRCIDELVDVCKTHVQGMSKAEADVWRSETKTMLTTLAMQKLANEDAMNLLKKLESWRCTETGEPDAADADVLNAQGVTLWNRKDYAGSRRRYERALAIRKFHSLPEHPQVLYNLALLLRLRGTTIADMDCAEGMIRRALALDPAVRGVDGSAVDILDGVRENRILLERQAVSVTPSRKSQLVKRLQGKLHGRSTDWEAEERQLRAQNVVNAEVVESATASCKATAEPVPTSGATSGSTAAQSNAEATVAADLAAEAQDLVLEELLAPPAAKGNKRKKRKPKSQLCSSNGSDAIGMEEKFDQGSFCDAEDACSAVTMSVQDSQKDVCSAVATSIEDSNIAQNGDADAARESVEELQSLLAERDEELLETHTNLQQMILFCDRQQTSLDELREQVKRLGLVPVV